MLQSDKRTVGTTEPKELKTSTQETRAYAAPQLLELGQALDLVQGGFQGGYFDGRNGRSYFRP